MNNIELTLESRNYHCDYIGNIGLLDQIDFAFLCSSKCPGNIIIKIQEQAFQWREDGLVIASGFHSPVEQEILNVLIKGIQPIVICPARSLNNMRLPKLWRAGLDENRILIITPIHGLITRPTRELCNKRNEFLVKLTKKIYIPYVDASGKMVELYNKLKEKDRLIFADNLENEAY